MRLDGVQGRKIILDKSSEIIALKVLSPPKSVYNFYISNSCNFANNCLIHIILWLNDRYWYSPPFLFSHPTSDSNSIDKIICNTGDSRARNSRIQSVSQSTQTESTFTLSRQITQADGITQKSTLQSPFLHFNTARSKSRAHTKRFALSRFDSPPSMSFPFRNSRVGE